MRKNKFVNPFQRIQHSPNDQYSNVKFSQKDLYYQNKFYFPGSQFSRLTPYQIEFSDQNDKKSSDKMHSSELYAIKEKTQIKLKNQRKASFRRQKKFQKVQPEKINDCTENRSKSLIKYNTLELKNLKGINFTSSGTTIYRNKNIKSLGKFNFQESPRKRGNSQMKKDLSVKNEKSCKLGLSKGKHNTRSNIKSKDNKMSLYQAYFKSKPDCHKKCSSFNATQKQLFFGEEEERFVQNAEDILCRSLIETQLYGNLETFDEQQYF